jgi:hypothetical protein
VRGDPAIRVLTNFNGVGNVEVNAFQRLSNVIIQKSVLGREGQERVRRQFLLPRRLLNELDLPNLHIPADGKIEVEVIANDTTLGAGKTRPLDGDGSALVLHATADDYQTKPAGNAGARPACGIVTR